MFGAAHLFTVVAASRLKFHDSFEVVLDEPGNRSLGIDFTECIQPGYGGEQFLAVVQQVGCMTWLVVVPEGVEHNHECYQIGLLLQHVSQHHLRYLQSSPSGEPDEPICSFAVEGSAGY